MRKSIIFTFVLLMFCVSALIGQPAQQMVRVMVSPDHADWLYAFGEEVHFDLTVVKNDVPLKNVEVYYEISEDMMPPIKKETKTLSDGKLRINAGTLKKAGFLRCNVFAKYNGRTYEGRTTVGFRPETIQPTAVLPADFLDFWEKSKDELAQVPMDARVRLLDDRCTSQVNVYEVNLQGYKIGCRVYAILCMPKAPGKYPALLKVPGAGVYPMQGEKGPAENGIITLEIGIHGIPVTMSGDVYRDLNNGALSNYSSFNLDNKNAYYYKRVYLGCVRAIDYIFSLPEFDGNLGVFGGSQGGALSIVTAALDSRVKGLFCVHPALCEMTGYLHGRAGGWPHFFNTEEQRKKDLSQKIETCGYYDVVNFARQLKVPGFYTFGFNDMVCPPTSMYSAYNVITAPKTLYLAEETAHFGYQEQWINGMDWLTNLLKK